MKIIFLQRQHLIKSSPKSGTVTPPICYSSEAVFLCLPFSGTPLESSNSTLHPAASTLRHRPASVHNKAVHIESSVNSVGTVSHWSGSILDSIGLDSWVMDGEEQLRIYCKCMLLLWVINLRSAREKWLKHIVKHAFYIKATCVTLQQYC